MSLFGSAKHTEHFSNAAQRARRRQTSSSQRHTLSASGSDGADEKSVNLRRIGLAVLRSESTHPYPSHTGGGGRIRRRSPSRRPATAKCLFAPRRRRDPIDSGRIRLFKPLHDQHTVSVPIGQRLVDASISAELFRAGMTTFSVAASYYADEHPANDQKRTYPE